MNQNCFQSRVLHLQRKDEIEESRCLVLAGKHLHVMNEVVGHKEEKDEKRRSTRTI